MVNVVIFTPETQSIEGIHVSKGYSISQDPHYYKRYFSGLVEMTLDDITWKRILLSEFNELPEIIQKLLSQENKKATEIINAHQMLLAA